jgi:hypothetical protein
MYFELLAAQQDRYIGGSCACHRELVLDLQLHVLGDPVPPKTRAEFTGSLALQDLDVRTSDDLAIDVREHETKRRVLENGIDLADLLPGTLRVSRCNVGL